MAPRPTSLVVEPGPRVRDGPVAPRPGRTRRRPEPGTRCPTRRPGRSPPHHPAHRGTTSTPGAMTSSCATRCAPRRPRRPTEPPAGSSSSVAAPAPLGLLTIAGLEAVRTADVLVCDRLAPGGTGAGQARRRSRPRRQDPAREFTPQEQINAILVDRALAGRRVVRLKGGDNFVFGRGGEGGMPASRPASRSRWCRESPPPSPCQPWPASR